MQTKLSLDKIYQYMHIQIIISIIKTGCIALVLELVLNLPFFLFVGIAGSYYITLHLLTHKNGIVINLSKGNLWCHFHSILEKTKRSIISILTY